MKLYLAGIEDRHANLDVQAFTDRDTAIAYVREWAQTKAHQPEDYEELRLPQYYEFYASYSPESDRVWVLARELDDPENLPGIHSGMSTVDNPVTGRPLGWIRVDDGDDAP